MANRSIIDASKEVTLALPAAGANANSASIDLGPNAGQIENVEIEIDVDATSALVDTKDIDVKLQDSADNSTFADIEELANPLVKVTSDGGGSSRTRLQVRLPRSAKRYIQMNVAVESAGGDVTANSAHLRLLF
jgi:hypothetical protein